jgi:ELWxxDGT repeat protein
MPYCYMMRPAYRISRSLPFVAAIVFLLSIGTAIMPFPSRAASEPAMQVTDINPGNSSANPESLIAIGGTLFFVADDGQHGRELWRSDGTAAGTTMVIDINSGSGSAAPSNLTPLGNTLFFVADDGQHGRELWRSDGTAAGTTMVIDINSGSGSVILSDLTALNGTLFFTLSTGCGCQRELWRSDGTAQETSLIHTFTAPDNGVTLALSSYNQTLVISVSLTTPNPDRAVQTLSGTPSADTVSASLWRSDGTPGGTVLLRSFDSVAVVSPATVSHHSLFFFVNGRELWRSDGTPANTTLVKDLTPFVSAYGSAPYALDVDGTLFFSLETELFSRPGWLFRSDGTAAGTILVRGLNGSCGSVWVRALVQLNHLIFFVDGDTTSACALWRSDGSVEGTVRLGDITSDNLAPGVRNTYMFSSIAGKVLFSTSETGTGQELWVSDGTTEGTSLFQDLAPAELSSDPRNIVIAGSRILFSATQGSEGRELWVMPLSVFLDKNHYLPILL